MKLILILNELPASKQYPCANLSGLKVGLVIISKSIILQLGSAK